MLHTHWAEKVSTNRTIQHIERWFTHLREFRSEKTVNISNDGLYIYYRLELLQFVLFYSFMKLKCRDWKIELHFKLFNQYFLRLFLIIKMYSNVLSLSRFIWIYLWRARKSLTQWSRFWLFNRPFISLKRSSCLNLESLYNNIISIDT